MVNYSGNDLHTHWLKFIKAKHIGLAHMPTLHSYTTWKYDMPSNVSKQNEKLFILPVTN